MTNRTNDLRMLQIHQKNFIMKISTTDNKSEFKWFRYGYEYNICVTDLYVKLQYIAPGMNNKMKYWYSNYRYYIDLI